MDLARCSLLFLALAIALDSFDLLHISNQVGKCIIESLVKLIVHIRQLYYMFYLASDNLKIPLRRDSNPWTVHYNKSTGKAFQKEMLC